MTINTKIQRFDRKRNMKVGVISDSQLSIFHKNRYTTFESNLAKAFGYFKSQNCEMIIFAGDICQIAGKNAYKKMNKTLQKIYHSDKPILQFIMGNHDYYSLRTSSGCRKLFENSLKQKPFTHYVVNGYHFIGASPANMQMTTGYKKVLPWLEEQIQIAVKDSPYKPIFVTVHNSPKNTVYGSDQWGEDTLGGIFKKYPNIVCFGGHTHYSLLDERCIYFGDYIAFGTQSVSYTEMEGGKENGSVPPAAYTAPMGYILDFGKEDIEVQRINFASGKQEKQSLYIPKIIKSKESFKDTRTASVPVMPDKIGSFETKKGITNIKFKAGRDSDLIHSYKLVFSDGSEQLYYSDFYNGIENMKKNVVLPLYNKKKGMYNIKVFALNSYGNISKNCTCIDNVAVNSKTRYKKIYSPEILL